MGGEPNRGPMMTRICWRLVDILSRMLDADERQAQGEMWVETKQKRLQQISGRLIHDVKFGGGLLGHLDQGGQFYVRQAEVEPGYWELTAMNVNMKGKVLFFKTIGVQQRETRSAFHRVADDLTPAQAVRIRRKRKSANNDSYSA